MPPIIAAPLIFLAGECVAFVLFWRIRKAFGSAESHGAARRRAVLKGILERAFLYIGLFRLLTTG